MKNTCFASYESYNWSIYSVTVGGYIGTVPIPWGIVELSGDVAKWLSPQSQAIAKNRHFFIFWC